MQSPALPSFCRSRWTCMSTVRVWMSGCACQTVSSSWARLWTRPSRSIRVRSSLNSVAVRRSEEHTSELQSRLHLVCRLLLEKKKAHTPLRIRDPDDDIEQLEF